MRVWIEKGFGHNDPYFLTQYIRGHLYIIMDSVLSINHVISSESGIELIHDLFVTFIDLYVKYLEEIPLYLKDVSE